MWSHWSEPIMKEVGGREVAEPKQEWTEREREREKGGSDQESGCELSMNMSSVTSKKSPKVDISCPKMIPLEK